MPFKHFSFSRVKKETYPVIQQLHKAKLRVIMITGDNFDTALSVSRECGILTPDLKVIAVHAFLRPGGDLEPSVEFSYVDVKSGRSLDDNANNGAAVVVDRRGRSDTSVIDIDKK